MKHDRSSPDEYRHREALVSTKWLNAHLRNPALRVFDCPAYLQALPPGSDAPYLSVSGEFEDECALLEPIVQGAGILYVVDGSKPYGPEYEAEMEILRWTGRPRMALVNPIGSADHIDAWQAALKQYFGIVRVFNAMSANFTKQ